MKKLLELYRDRVMGAISGLDRVRFRGTLRWLASERGLSTYMSYAKILLKDFSDWVNGLTAQVRASCESRAKDLGIEVRYLAGSGVDKDKLARQIAKDKRITEGSICLLSAVDPCIAPKVKGNKASKKLELVTFVGDRLTASIAQASGMIKSAQIKELPEGFHYITAITKPQIKSLVTQWVIQRELFDKEVCEVKDGDVRYIVRRNPYRAEEVSQTRRSKRA